MILQNKTGKQRIKEQRTKETNIKQKTSSKTVDKLRYISYSKCK